MSKKELMDALVKRGFKKEDLEDWSVKDLEDRLKELEAKEKQEAEDKAKAEAEAKEAARKAEEDRLAALAAARGSNVRMRAPKGCGGISVNGMELKIGKDGFVEAPGNAAGIEQLRAHGFTFE